MRKLMYIAAGGFVGACLRFAISQYKLFGNGGFGLLNTLVPNLFGAFALGFFLTASGRLFYPGENLHPGVAVGLLGALTTFSTLCAQTVALAANGQMLSAFFYVLGSVALGLLSAWVGELLAQSLLKKQAQFSNSR